MEFTYEYYREMLSSALRSNYTFIGFDQLEEFRQSELPACVLRHDCDNDLGAARQLASVEAEHEVRSTYFIMLQSVMYNALSLSACKTIEAIVNQGHHIALHFDESRFQTLATNDLISEIDFQIALFARTFDVEPSAVSFHQPGARILSNELKIQRINTYDRTHLSGFDYVSDSSSIMRINLPRMFAQRTFHRLQLNLHPEWWSEEVLSVSERWQNMLSHNLEMCQRELWDRENSFPQKQSLKFSAIGEYRCLPEAMVYVRYEL